MRFLLLGCAIGATTWMIGVGCAWVYLRYQRDFSTARFADMLFPHRWPDFRTSRGDHYIAQAESQLKKQDAASALHLLRAGLAQSPANSRGRLLLANLYQQARRPDLAREVFQGGLPHLAHDYDYLAATLSFYNHQQEDAEILNLTASRLNHHPPQPLRRLLAIHAAHAAYQRGRYDLAEDFISQHGLTETTEGLQLQARIEWARGLPDLAIARLTARLHREPTNIAIHALLSDFYRRQGRETEWQTSVIAQLAADPLAPTPRIEHLRLLRHQGNLARLSREADDFLNHFALDPDALLQLAGFAAETGQPALAQQVRAALPQESDSNRSAALLVAEAHLVAGEHAAALATLTELSRDHPTHSKQLEQGALGLQAIALYGLGQIAEARTQLDLFLARPDLRAEALVTVAQRLTAVGAADAARTVLTRAIERDPLNQAALTHLIELTLPANDPPALVAHLEHYLRLRQPSRSLLLRVRESLGSDRHLFLAEQAHTLNAIRTALQTAH